MDNVEIDGFTGGLKAVTVIIFVVLVEVDDISPTNQSYRIKTKQNCKTRPAMGDFVS